MTALRETPCATLAEIRAFIEAGGEQGMWLGAVTIGELITPPPRTARDPRPSLPIDRLRLNRAKRCTGADFDALVYEVLGEAGGCVGASYLRERVGGPRWKLHGSLRRLVEAGKVLRLRKLCRGLDLQLSTLFESHELCERNHLREFVDLLATRSTHEIMCAYKMVRVMFDGFDANNQERREQ